MSIHAFSAPAAGPRTEPPGRGSRFLDEAAVGAALDAVTPAIAAQLASPVVSGLGVLYLVVLDPSHPCTDAAQQPRVLAERAIGDRSRWDVDYASYAHRKALLSWRHRMDSRQLQMLSPHLLRADEEPLWGSVWLDGRQRRLPDLGRLLFADGRRSTARPCLGCGPSQSLTNLVSLPPFSFRHRKTRP